jgi:hypothetical protein
LVAKELQGGGNEVLVPVLPDATNLKAPYWRHFADAVARSVQEVAQESPLLFVGHSNSGPRLPCYRIACGRKAAGYIFVDAGLPGIAASGPQLERLRQQAVNGMVASWREDLLIDEIPDPHVRSRFMAELPPSWPLALFTESPPVFPGWPDAPCAYLRLTDGYPEAVSEAIRRGWPLLGAPGSHFQMLVDPATTASALKQLALRIASE